MPGAAFHGPTPMNRHRSILLVDCDTFFVQVARLEDPQGAGRAPLLMVGGSAEGRGVVTSADYRVREHGVRSGMPMARAVELCPEAMVVPVPRDACLRRSRAVRAVLDRVAPVVQAASIDEFYLDLTGTERLFEGAPLEATAHRIRERILDEAEITVSIGGGTTRLVAKLAVERAKPAGAHIVAPGQEEAFLRSHPVGAIPGIGPVFLEKLAERGIRSVEELLAVEPEWLARWFGAERASWLRDRARGIDPSPVDAGTERKSISSERTFARDLEAPERLAAELHRAVLEVGGGLRRRGLGARTVTVKIRDHDFRTRQASRTLALPVASDRAIFRVARELLDELRARRPVPVRLLGVGLSSLEGEGPALQLELPVTGGDDPVGIESEADLSLAKAADALRKRFGRDALVPGRILERPGSMGRRDTHEPEEEG